MVVASPIWLYRSASAAARTHQSSAETPSPNPKVEALLGLTGKTKFSKPLRQRLDEESRLISLRNARSVVISVARGSYQPRQDKRGRDTDWTTRQASFQREDRNHRCQPRDLMSYPKRRVPAGPVDRSSLPKQKAPANCETN